MVRHFETKYKAKKFLASKTYDYGLTIYRKKKGHLNRGNKPFVVCTYIEWLNLY